MVRHSQPKLQREVSPSAVPGTVRGRLDQQSLRHTAVTGGGSGGVSPTMPTALGSPGQPLDPDIRAVMEQRFGHDFSGVRIHTDAQAAESAQAINARAYTIGQDVVFGAGEHQPHSSAGRHLLAHELAHVVQQGRGGQPPATQSGGPLEQAAEQAAGAVVFGSGPVEVAGASAVGIARAPQFQNTTPRYFEGTLLLTVELPLGTGTAPRSGVEQDFHGYLPPGVIEDAERWHASHSVGPIVGVEREEGILLAPRGVNLSVQKNLENSINSIRAARQQAPGSRLFLKIEASAHPGTRRLSTINYELWGVDPDGTSGVMLTASVQVSNSLDPHVDVAVGNIRAGALEAEAGRRYTDAFNISKRQSATSEEDKKQPLRPRSSAPATYSATTSTLKRQEVPNPEVTTRRPSPSATPAAAPPTPAPQAATPAAEPAPATVLATQPGAATPPAATAPAAGAPTTAQAEPAAVAPAGPTGAAATPAAPAATPPAGGTARPTSPGERPPIVGSQGQRVFTGRRSEGPAVVVPQAPQAAGRQAAAMAVQMAMAKLDEIGRAIQDQDARTMIASRRREIIDWLRVHPGLGAVIEVQFLEPEHRFQDVTWRSSDDPYAGKPTRVANPEARQPQSTFLYVEPMREAQAGQAAPGAAPPTEVKTGAEFVAAYGKARGADLAGTGTVAVEMHEALRQGTKVFGYTDVRVGNTTIRLTDAARGSIEEAVGQLARQATTKRLGRLKRGIDTQQARLTERLRQWFSGGVKLTGHE
ncbi:MAG: eCIS core domain-containing protein, partial [Thermomicrobiales bacterium]